MRLLAIALIVQAFFLSCKSSRSQDNPVVDQLQETWHLGYWKRGSGTPRAGNYETLWLHESGQFEYESGINSTNFPQFNSSTKLSGNYVFNGSTLTLTVLRYSNERASDMVETENQYCLYYVAITGWDTSVCTNKIITMKIGQGVNPGLEIYGADPNPSRTLRASEAPGPWVPVTAGKIIDRPVEKEPINGWTRIPGQSVSIKILRLLATESNLFVSTEKRLLHARTDEKLSDMFQDSTANTYGVSEFIWTDKVYGLLWSGTDLYEIKPQKTEGSGNNVYWSGNRLGPLFQSNSGSQLTSIHVQGNTIYVGEKSKGLAISLDQGKTFTVKTASDGLASSQITSLAGNSNKLFVATPAGLSISNDQGTTYTTRNSSHGLGDNSIQRLLLTDLALYAVSGRNLSISLDSGETFTNKVLEFPIDDIAAQGTALYIASGGKVLFSVDGGNTFSEELFGNGNASRIAITATRLYVASDKGLFFKNRASALISRP